VQVWHAWSCAAVEKFNPPGSVWFAAAAASGDVNPGGSASADEDPTWPLLARCRIDAGCGSRRSLKDRHALSAACRAPK